jgi:hypothetical protein
MAKATPKKTPAKKGPVKKAVAKKTPNSHAKAAAKLKKTTAKKKAAAKNWDRAFKPWDRALRAINGDVEALEVDRMCDVATKRLRRLEVSPPLEPAASPDPNYGSANRALKAAPATPLCPLAWRAPPWAALASRAGRTSLALPGSRCPPGTSYMAIYRHICI